MEQQMMSGLSGTDDYTNPPKAIVPRGINMCAYLMKLAATHSCGIWSDIIRRPHATCSIRQYLLI